MDADEKDAEIRRLQDDLAAAHQKIRDIEQEHVLPCFELAKSVGMDLQAEVHKQAGKPSTEILVRWLIESQEHTRQLANKNADQAMSEMRKAREVAMLVAAAERGRTVAECEVEQYKEFMMWATGSPLWDQFEDQVKKRWMELQNARSPLIDSMSPVYKAERYLIRVVLDLDNCAKEFDGDLKPCGEKIDNLWEAVDKYRKLLWSMTK